MSDADILGMRGCLTALGEAAWSGSFGCVPALPGEVSADGNRPSALAVAAAAGHCDIVRLLLGSRTWPAEDMNEASTYALMLGHGAMWRHWRQDPEAAVKWSDRTWDLFSRLRRDRLERCLALERILPEFESLMKRSRNRGGLVFTHLVRHACVSAEMAAVALRLTPGGLWPELDGLRPLNVPASRVSGRRLFQGWWLSKAEKAFGPPAEWDVDPCTCVRPVDWPRLLAARRALNWAQHGDGSEYRPALVGIEGLPHDCADALAATSVDFSRIHFCGNAGRCDCGYERLAKDVATFVTQRGARPCGKSCVQRSPRKSRLPKRDGASADDCDSCLP